MRGSGLPMDSKIVNLVKLEHWVRAKLFHPKAQFQACVCFSPESSAGTRYKERRSQRTPYTLWNLTRDLSTARDNGRESTPVPVTVSPLGGKHTCRCTNKAQGCEARCLLTTNRSLITMVASSCPQAPVWCWPG